VFTQVTLLVFAENTFYLCWSKKKFLSLLFKKKKFATSKRLLGLGYLG
jgi:hypothetical protein